MVIYYNKRERSMISRTSLLKDRKRSISFMTPSILMGMDRRPIAIKTLTKQPTPFNRHLIVKTRSDNLGPTHITVIFQVSTNPHHHLHNKNKPNLLSSPPHNPGNSTCANSTERTWPRTGRLLATGSISPIL